MKPEILSREPLEWMGCDMEPGLVGSKNSKAHRDTGNRNDNLPPIFCLGLRKGRRDPTHTQTHLHMCVRMHTCSHGLALTLLRPPVPLHISSTHFLLHKVAPPTHHTQELAATNTAILY